MNAAQFCAACGARNDSDATFCESCGSSLAPQYGAGSQGAPPVASAPEQSGPWGRRVMIGLVVLAIGGGIYLRFVEPLMVERYLATQQTPEARLMSHAVAGVADSVRAILQEGVSPNVLVDGWALSPLMGAAQNGKLEAVQALLAAGADPNLRAQDGATALFWAVASTAPERFEVATALLAAGADPNATTSAGESPRSLATQRGDSELLAGFDAFDRVDEPGVVLPPAPPLGPASP